MIEHETAGRHFVAITDEGTALQRLAAEENFGRVFINPSDIGGRYSALSYFGLVPAALQGIDLKQTAWTAPCRWRPGASPTALPTPGYGLGALLGGMALHGEDKVTFVLSPGDAYVWLLGRATDCRELRQTRPRHRAS